MRVTITATLAPPVATRVRDTSPDRILFVGEPSQESHYNVPVVQALAGVHVAAGVAVLIGRTAALLAGGLDGSLAPVVALVATGPLAGDLHGLALAIGRARARGAVVLGTTIVPGSKDWLTIDPEALPALGGTRTARHAIWLRDLPVVTDAEVAASAPTPATPLGEAVWPDDWTEGHIATLDRHTLARELRRRTGRAPAASLMNMRQELAIFAQQARDLGE